MSKLLNSNRRYSVKAWQAERKVVAELLEKLKANLETHTREANDPTRDVFFAQPHLEAIQLLEVQITRQTAVLEVVDAKLAEAKVARPVALKAAEEAQRERDKLAEMIRVRFPEASQEIVEMLRKSADVEAKLRDVAATGEVQDLDVTSPWDKARGIERKPLVVQGRGSAPDVRLVSLEGEELWPVVPGSPLTVYDLPATVTVKNTSRQPVSAVRPDGKPVIIAPGDSITGADLPVDGFVGSLSIELSVA